MKQRSLVMGLATLLVGSVAASLPGCNSSSSSGAPGAIGAGGADTSSAMNAAGSDDAERPSKSADGGEPSDTTDPDPKGNGGAPGSGDPRGGDAGAPGSSSDVAPLPSSAFLYVYSDTADHDFLVARDLATGKERLVTDLKADGSEGWEIWGHSISPDRKRIVIASLFGPTRADVDTGLSTRRIWTLAADGSDFQRLTPVFENTGTTLKNFNISLQDPVFSADGRDVIYDYGNWWYEGNTLKGGSLPWSVSTNGGLPTSFETTTGCSVIHPSVNPATGDVLFVHSVCLRSDDEGLFLYPRDGGSEPIKVVDEGFGEGEVDPALEKASWVGDGSGFIFVGSIQVARGASTEQAKSLLAYDAASGEIQVLVIPDAGAAVQNATIAPDASVIVYCLAHDDVYDLHAIDLSLDPPEDAAITDDGKSCDPGF
jgi:hypothetical protein